jgi:hypothetical protein
MELIIGEKYVPHAKTAGDKPLDGSICWKKALEKGQAYLYYTGIDCGKYCFDDTYTPGCIDGDYFNPEDVTPYIKNSNEKIMKLAKALKLKNKKVSEYIDALNKMQSCNSIDKDAKKHYNARFLSETAHNMMMDIVNLKTAIHNTSAPIRKDIFLIGELKNYLNRINSISTTEGEVKQSLYSGISIVNYIVDINESDKVEMVKKLQTEIENLQDSIDAFNATTDIVGYEE